jgi:hypothetical protein
LAHDGFVRRTLRFLSRASDRRGDVFTCHGRIVGLSEHDGSQIAELELWTENVEASAPRWAPPRCSSAR